MITPVSKSTKKHLKNTGKKKDRIVGFFPVDPHDCDCRFKIDEYKAKFAEMNKAQRKGRLVCPKDRKGYNPYKVICTSCDAVLAHLWSKTKRVTTDWCDLHYICEYDKDKWTGAKSVHISPVDGQLCFECTCGVDSRDFRANSSLPPQKALSIEKANAKGRAFGYRNSKFRLEELKNG